MEAFALAELVHCLATGAEELAAPPRPDSLAPPAPDVSANLSASAAFAQRGLSFSEAVRHILASRRIIQPSSSSSSFLIASSILRLHESLCILGIPQCIQIFPSNLSVILNSRGAPSTRSLHSGRPRQVPSIFAPPATFSSADFVWSLGSGSPPPRLGFGRLGTAFTAKTSSALHWSSAGSL